MTFLFTLFNIGATETIYAKGFEFGLSIFKRILFIISATIKQYHASENYLAKQFGIKNLIIIM